MKYNGSAKKVREQKILLEVYRKTEFTSINPSERPDFIVTPKIGRQFGVEITESYITESLARIRNIPGYVSEMISGKYRHKDDFISLPVQEFTIVRNGEKSGEKIKGLFQKQPDIQTYRNNIAECIKEKNNNFSSYIKGLTHVNLIISDQNNILNGLPKDQIHSYLFDQGFEKNLVESNFREIFLITNLGSYNSSQRVYIPLKMLFLVTEAYRFNFIMVKYYKHKHNEFKESILFGEFLRWRGAKDIFLKEEDRGFEITYGNTGVFLSKNNELTIRMHSDFSLSDEYTMVNDQLSRNFFDKEFEKHFMEDCATSTFNSELYFPINQENLPVGNSATQ